MDALRNDRIDEFTTTSPYAACLLPLLNELGWNNYARELVEALPLFCRAVRPDRSAQYPGDSGLKVLR